MKETIYLVDYAGEPTKVELELDGLMTAKITVLTGDEILEAIYDDGNIETYDSSNCRRYDFYDGEYVVFVRGSINNLKYFGADRVKDSYEQMGRSYEEEEET